MKKILISTAVLMMVAGCSSQQPLLVENEVQTNISSITTLDNSDFTRKMQNPATYKVKTKLPKSICGQNDLQQVNSYDGNLGQPVDFVNAHKNPVGAMEDSGSDKADKFCSGTLIGENLFLTASHCVDSSTPKSQYIALNYEKVKGSNSLLPQKHFKITKVVESHLGGLDYAILQLDGKPGAEFGWTKLRAVTPANGEKLTIIQHPSGEPKQIEIGNMVGTEGTYMKYEDLDTEPGSSGSGVLDANGNVVGVHTNGGCFSSGGANRGVLLSEIVKVSKVVKELNTAKR